MRLAGGVAQHGGSLGEGGGHERVLGRGDAGLVEEDVGAPQARGRELVVASPAETVAPSCSRARKWVSTRRRPMTSPPGGGSDDVPRASERAVRRAGWTRGSARRAPDRAAPEPRFAAWMTSVLRVGPLRVDRRPCR